MSVVLLLTLFQASSPVGTYICCWHRLVQIAMLVQLGSELALVCIQHFLLCNHAM